MFTRRTILATAAAVPATAVLTRSALAATPYKLARGDNGFGARVEMDDLADLAQTPAGLAELTRLLDKYMVLQISPKAPLTKTQVGRIGLGLGHPGDKDDPAGLEFVRNVGGKAKPLVRIHRQPAFAEQLHYDRYKGGPPGAYSILASVDIAPTTPYLFVDMREVYADLPRHLKEIVDTRYCLHAPLPAGGKPLSAAPPFDSAKAPRRPLSIKHPRTGQPLMWVPQTPMSVIEGMPEDEGRAILRELWVHTYKSPARHTMQLQDNDLLVWDNLVLQHTNPEYPRTIERVAWFFVVPAPGGKLIPNVVA